MRKVSHWFCCSAGTGGSFIGSFGSAGAEASTAGRLLFVIRCLGGGVGGLEDPEDE